MTTLALCNKQIHFLVTFEKWKVHIIWRWRWKDNFQTMLKLNVVLTLTLASLSSARLVETSLGPVMGERFTIIIIGDKNHPRPHQDIHSGPTLWRSSHYLWFILGAPLCRSSCRCVIHIIHENDNICFYKSMTMIYMKRAFAEMMKLLIWSMGQHIIYLYFSSGDLRFSPPVEATPWTETRNATKAKPIIHTYIYKGTHCEKSHTFWSMCSNTRI